MCLAVWNFLLFRKLIIERRQTKYLISPAGALARLKHLHLERSLERLNAFNSLGAAAFMLALFLSLGVPWWMKQAKISTFVELTF